MTRCRMAEMVYDLVRALPYAKVETLAAWCRVEPTDPMLADVLRDFTQNRVIELTVLGIRRIAEEELTHPRFQERAPGHAAVVAAVVYDGALGRAG